MSGGVARRDETALLGNVIGSQSDSLFRELNGKQKLRIQKPECDAVSGSRETEDHGAVPGNSQSLLGRSRALHTDADRFNAIASRVHLNESDAPKPEKIPGESIWEKMRAFANPRAT
jgi:hypothetical protein